MSNSLVNPDNVSSVLLASLEKLSFAALARDASSGDPMAAMSAKAQLEAVNKEVMDVIKQARDLALAPIANERLSADEAKQIQEYLEVFLDVTVEIQDGQVIMHDRLYAISPDTYQKRDVATQPFVINSFEEARQIADRRLSAHRDAEASCMPVITPNFESFFAKAQSLGLEVSDNVLERYQWGADDRLYHAENAFDGDMLDRMGGNRFVDRMDDMETPQFMYVFVRDQQLQRIAQHQNQIIVEGLDHIAISHADWGYVESELTLKNGKLLIAGGPNSMPVFECLSKIDVFFDGEVFEFPLEASLRPEWSVVFKYIEDNAKGDVDFAFQLMNAACENVLSNDYETPSL